MYRITNINTTLSTKMDEILYVRQGENGWEFWPTKDENGNPIDPASEAEYISVPDYAGGEPIWGICRLDNTLPEGEECEYPVVRVVWDNGLAMAQLEQTTGENTTQIEETQEAVAELTEVNDTVTNEIYEGLTESTETVLEMIADLAARVEELEGNLKERWMDNVENLR